MRIAVALRDHLPAVAAMYLRGELSTRVIGAITWRTQFITDEAVWAVVDAEVAKRAIKWGPLAEDKLVAAVDALVLEFDAAALMVSKTVARSRDFVVGDIEDENGTTSVWCRLSSADAAALKKKISAMVATVCENDPRSVNERRAAAMGAWSHGNDHLPCACESPNCSARAAYPAPKSSVVINVYTDQATLEGLRSEAPPIDAPSTPTSSGTAVLSGTEVLPTPLLAELLRNGAKLRPLCVPAEEPESGYRPSAALERFVRAEI